MARTPSGQARVLHPDEFYHRAQKQTGRTGTWPYRAGEGRNRVRVLVARSERDGRPGRAQGRSPNAMTSPEERNSTTAGTSISLPATPVTRGKGVGVGLGLGRPHDITAAAHRVPTSAGRARSHVRPAWFRVRVRVRFGLGLGFGLRVRVRVKG